MVSKREKPDKDIEIAAAKKCADSKSIPKKP